MSNTYITVKKEEGYTLKHQEISIDTKEVLDAHLSNIPSNHIYHLKERYCNSVNELELPKFETLDNLGTHNPTGLVFTILHGCLIIEKAFTANTEAIQTCHYRIGVGTEGSNQIALADYVAYDVINGKFYYKYYRDQANVDYIGESDDETASNILVAATQLKHGLVKFKGYSNYLIRKSLEAVRDISLVKTIVIETPVDSDGNVEVFVNGIEVKDGVLTRGALVNMLMGKGFRFIPPADFDVEPLIINAVDQINMVIGLMVKNEVNWYVCSRLVESINTNIPLLLKKIIADTTDGEDTVQTDTLGPRLKYVVKYIGTLENGEILVKAFDCNSGKQIITTMSKLKSMMNYLDNIELFDIFNDTYIKTNNILPSQVLFSTTATKVIVANVNQRHTQSMVPLEQDVTLTLDPMAVISNVDTWIKVDFSDGYVEYMCLDNDDLTVDTFDKYLTYLNNGVTVTLLDTPYIIASLLSHSKTIVTLTTNFAEEAYCDTEQCEIKSVENPLNKSTLILPYPSSESTNGGIGRCALLSSIPSNSPQTLEVEGEYDEDNSELGDVCILSSRIIKSIPSEENRVLYIIEVNYNELTEEYNITCYLPLSEVSHKMVTYIGDIDTPTSELLGNISEIIKMAGINSFNIPKIENALEVANETALQHNRSVRLTIRMLDGATYLTLL